jgi:hypothetical protein
MDTDTRQPATKKHRPRFPFSLRTLLLLVAGVSVLLGWEARIVREHKAMLAKIVAAGGSYNSNRPNDPEAFYYDWKDRYEPPLIRHLLGEPEIHAISLPFGFPKDEEQRAVEMFPGAYVRGGLL